MKRQFVDFDAMLSRKVNTNSKFSWCLLILISQHDHAVNFNTKFQQYHVEFEGSDDDYIKFSDIDQYCITLLKTYAPICKIYKRHTSDRLDENHHFFSGKTSWVFTMPLGKNNACNSVFEWRECLRTCLLKRPRWGVSPPQCRWMSIGRLDYLRLEKFRYSRSLGRSRR